MNKKKNLLIVIIVISLVFIFLVGFFIFNRHMLKTNFENDILPFARKNQNTIFKINKITFFSSCDAKNKTASNSNFTIEDLYQYTDIALFITSTSEEKTLENTLKKVSINNIKFTSSPTLGEPKLYYKNINNFAKSEISEENLINENLDFNITSEALNLTAKLDIDSHNNNNNGIIYNWIELLAYLACKNGGDFKSFKKSDLDTLVNKLSNVETISDLTNNLKFYDYYYESYSAVLSNFIGNYEIETENEDGTKSFKSRYGLKAFLPIAKNYSFSHYDDFGNSRSYGFKRTHLGNDLMGSIGIPIIAVESGIVENLGWNQYGGWRIGIRSFDTKRYYYYAHLRKNHPYAEGLEEGKTVNAGDVIGYLGMTGYSTKENVNNINVPHLHFGLQLIFDESQVDSPNEIWIDVYQIIEFLKNSRSEVYMNNKETKDYVRKYAFNENTSF